jgi:hypothetical protein
MNGNIERKTVNGSDADYEYDKTPGGSVFDGDITKTYIYANSQILAQHNGPPVTNNKFFCLHDRLNHRLMAMFDNAAQLFFQCKWVFG